MVHPLTQAAATSYRVFCTIRSADTAKYVNKPPIRAQKSAKLLLRSAAQTARPGCFGHPDESFLCAGSGGGEDTSPRLHCFVWIAVLPSGDAWSVNPVGSPHPPPAGLFSYPIHVRGTETVAPSQAVLHPVCGLYLFRAYVLTTFRGHRAGDAGDVRDLSGQGPSRPRDRGRYLRLFSGLPGARAVAAETIRASGYVATPQGGGPQETRGASAF